MTAVFFTLWFISLGSGLLAAPSVHAWQLEAYKPPQYMRWLRSDAKRVYRFLAAGWARSLMLLAAVFAVLTVFSLAASFSLPEPAAFAAFATALAGGAAWGAARYLRSPHKKPLKFTARIKRLIAAIAVFSAIPAAAFMVPVGWLSGLSDGSGIPRLAASALILLAYFTLTVFLQPLRVVLAGLLVRPLESRVNRWYFEDARKKLAGWDRMVKIGITGSYGKTSSKVILGTILRERFDVLATPHSYNTPMGVARVVRGQMTGREEVFIAEMGARQRGDIAEMCALVGPRYGLLTSIGPQHLETFGTVENVARAKYELVESLTPGGWAFFPSDNAVCLDLYRETKGNKLLFGLDGHGEPLYMTARDIRTTRQGSEFTLDDGEGKGVPCATRLLGRHNITNILGCAAVARKMGLTMAEIASGIARTEPVEHRLQLIPAANGATVIDDAYNASPDGARAALEVLASFPGRKIVVTPGLVELGEAGERENELFGERMAAVADIAILVARNGEAIARGLLRQDFAGRIIRVPNLGEATRELSGLVRAADAVLFENDLPDHYEQ